MKKYTPVILILIVIIYCVVGYNTWQQREVKHNQTLAKLDSMTVTAQHILTTAQQMNKAFDQIKKQNEISDSITHPH